MHTLATLIVLAQMLAAEVISNPPSTPVPVVTPNTVTPKDNPPATITPSPPVRGQTPTVEPHVGHSTSGEHVGKPD